MKLEDKLYLLKFKPEEKTHLMPKEEDCQRCQGRPCTSFCPAQVYKWEGEKLVVSYENCLECGTCRVACTREGVRWEYPNGGMGVKYRFG